MNENIRTMLAPAIVELIAYMPETPTPAAVHAALWPYVSAIVPADPSGAPAEPPRDRRVRPWRYVLRFWLNGEVIAETDPEIIEGTGNIPPIIAGYAAELHEGAIPYELTQAAVKDRLPQLRNNLGRAKASVLRIPYEHEGREYLCQMDVHRLGR